MKRFLFLTVLGALLVTAAQAQSGSLTVVNNSSCTVYYSIFGDVAGGCGAHQYQSRVIAIAAGGIHNYPDPSTVPGGVNCVGGGCTPPTLGSSDGFVGAELYHNGPGCGAAPTGIVGELCSGWPGAHSGYHVENAACVISCMHINAMWVTGATLTFN